MFSLANAKTGSITLSFSETCMTTNCHANNGSVPGLPYNSRQNVVKKCKYRNKYDVFIIANNVTELYTL